MNFIQANIGTIVVGAIVCAAISAVVIRLIVNFRKGKAGCACGGCPGCGSR